MKRLDIQFIGGWQLKYAEASLPGVTGKRARSLLSYLILHHQTNHSRETLAELFWPNSSTKQARANLRRELLTLRRWHPIASEFIEDQNGSLKWDMPQEYRFDIETISNCLNVLANGQWATESIGLLSEFNHSAVLSGVSDEWSAKFQSGLTEQFLEATLFSLQSNRQRMPETDYLALTRRVLLINDLDELAWELLIETHLSRNELAQARQSWLQCERTLREELGTAPGEALQTLYRTKLQTEKSPSTPSSPTHAHHLIGRDRQWTQLTDLLSSNRACLTVIEGPPGIGKTALAEAFSRYCGQQGRIIATARASHASTKSALSALIAWLQHREFSQHIESLDKSARVLLGNILPDIFPEQNTNIQGTPERFRRERLFEAITRIFKSRVQPLVLFIDDIQWCDDDTLDWLGYVFQKHQDLNVIILATKRSTEEAHSRAYQSLVEAIDKQRLYTSLTLGGLNPEYVKQLGEHKFKSANVHHWKQYLEYLNSAGGNPFFIIEMVRAIAHDQHREKRSQVSRLGTTDLYKVITTRLEHLSRSGHTSLQLLSALHRPFSDSEFRRLSGQESLQAANTIKELIHANVLSIGVDSLYHFEHDCIAEAVYTEMSIPHRRHYHLQISDMLRDEDNLNINSGEVAYHLQYGGEIYEAINWYAKASNEANDRLSSVTAIQHTNSALELVDTLQRNRSLDSLKADLLLQKLICLQVIEGFVSESIEITVQALEQQLERVTDIRQRLVINNRIRTVYVNTDLQKALATDRASMAMIKSISDPILPVTVRRSMGFTELLMGRYEESTNTLQSARKISNRSHRLEEVNGNGDLSDIPIALAMLGVSAWINGKPEITNEVLEELALVKVHEFPGLLQVYARTFLWQIYLFKGDSENLDMQHHWYEQSTKNQIHRLIEDNALWVSGIVAWTQGDLKQASSLLRQAIGKLDIHTTAIQPQRRVQLAEVLLLQGDTTEAASYLKQAAHSAATTPQKNWESERLRVESLLLAATGADSCSVQRHYTEAIRVASDQRASWFEIRARVSLSDYLRRIEQHERAESERQAVVRRFGHLTDYPEIRGLTSRSERKS